MRLINKAKKGDYPDYAEMYMKWLPDDGKVLEHLLTNFLDNKKFIYSLPESMLYHRYQPGKWSIKGTYWCISLTTKETISLSGITVCAQRKKQPHRF